MLVGAAPMSEGLLSRWSRRKTAARQGVELPSPPLQPDLTRTNPVAADGVTPVSPAPAEVAPGAAAAPTPTPAQSAPEAAPELTLADVQALTPTSDFSPFVSRSVAPQVRNAAMKKLFADPHYNVMDGLDIYIDDYSKPDPLPASMLRQMVSAHFLKLVDEPQNPPNAVESTSGVAPPELQPVGTEPLETTPVAATLPGAQPDPDAVTSPSNSPSAHDHPDL